MWLFSRSYLSRLLWKQTHFLTQNTEEKHVTRPNECAVIKGPFVPLRNPKPDKEIIQNQNGKLAPYHQTTFRKLDDSHLTPHFDGHSLLTAIENQRSKYQLLKIPVSMPTFCLITSNFSNFLGHKEFPRSQRISSFKIKMTGY